MAWGGAKIDFKKPVELTLYKDGNEKKYQVLVFSYTGLPIVWIETEGRKDIGSKIDYVKASFKLVENVVTRNAGDILIDSVEIKGRGNSSWYIAQKKSFRLKFDKKVSLLGEPKDKSWVLIANAFDKTMLRNEVAYFIGRLSNLEYTPKFHFVELFLNGYYWGTYMLGDKLKISENRVNVGKDGYLLEVDQRAPEENEPHFKVKHLDQPVNIKDPDVVVGDEKYTYIMNYIQEADSILFSENFKDPINGWQKYMDIDSFVDWYIIHEIARNYDPLHLYTSCFMNIKKGGKLRMGPIWDFDVTFGNNQNPEVYPIEGLAGKKSSWYYRLLEDPVFLQRVKVRYSFFYQSRDNIFKYLNENSLYLRYSIIENNNRWGVLYNMGFGNHDVWGSYQNEVQQLKNWIYNRMNWLNNYFVSN